MKKVFAFLMIAGMVTFVACSSGPSDEEKKAMEKARLDSIAKVETEKAAAEQLRVADSLAAVAAEQQRVTDSILAATEAAAKKGTGKPKKTEQQKSTETKVSGKGH